MFIYALDSYIYENMFTAIYARKEKPLYLLIFYYHTSTGPPRQNLNQLTGHVECIVNVYVCAHM